ncbi:MAG: bile acid:sodium symporter [Planctomycetia bacterium]|nr:bile acid:sodium symporter [Planctomycetia bacterium]
MISHHVVNLVVTITLIEMMATVGLEVDWGDLVSVFQNWRGVIRAAVANYLIVPAAAFALLEFYAGSGNAAVGILILAAFPGASYGPPFSKVARGDVSLAVGLMVVLAASSVVVGPCLLRTMMHLTSVRTTLHIDVVSIIGILALTQLVPLAIGMLMRRFWPRVASKLQSPAHLISKILNGCSIACILASERERVSPFHFVSAGAMLAVLLASLFAGYLLGGPGVKGRKTFALTTSLRNIGVSVVVASGHFTDHAVLATIVGYAVIEVSVSFLLALWWGWGRTMVRRAAVPSAGAASSA